MQLNLNHRFDRELFTALGNLATLLERSIAIGERNMAAIDDLRIKWAETNASLDNVQADLAALLAQVNSGGLTAAETAEALSNANQIADKAAAIAAIVTP